MLRWRLILVLVVALFFGAGIAADDLTMPDEPIHWREMTASHLPNAWLVCPTNVCRSEDEGAPVYRVPAVALRDDWDDVVAAQPRVERVRIDRDGLGATYIATSKTFGFRDRINVRFMPHGDGHSTLAVHSRSEIGLYDFGVNKRRLGEWLGALSHLEQQFDVKPRPQRVRPEVLLPGRPADAGQ